MRYQNMLVSPRLGGGEKLALAIHHYIASMDPGQARLVIPEGGETAALAVREALPHVTYSLEGVTAPRRLRSLLANAALGWRLAGSDGLLHVHSPFVYGALRPMLAVAGLKTVLHLHLDYTAEQLQWAFKRPPDVVMMCANFMRDRVETALAGHPRSNTRVVALVNAVDTQRFAPGERAQVKQKLGIAAEQPLLLMAANLAPHKGQITAIRAVAELHRRGWHPLLWLVGEERETGGHHMSQLRFLIAQAGLEQVVQLLGFRNDVPTLLQAADFLLLPSTSEGLPLAILEAQASRALVLAAPTAGIPEVVEHDRTGYLIGADDAHGYADILESLLREPARAEVVRDRALQRVQADFAMPRYCEKVLLEYRQLLGGG